MKRKILLPLMAAALLLTTNALSLSYTQPVLLENDDALPPTGIVSLADNRQGEANPLEYANRVDVFLLDGIVSLADDPVPLSDMPASDAQQGEADPYEGLDETQIKYVNRVLELVNAARADAGVPALTLDPTLRAAAQVRAEECVGTFSHTRPDGTSYKTAITEAGITASYTGENVATGHTSAEQVVERWLQSEGHRENILNAGYTKIGIGLEENTGNRYRGYSWVQLFTN